MVAPPTSTGTPSLRHTRAALRQVAEVVLGENEALLHVPPVARTVGPPAISGHVRAKLREAERSGDAEAEREHALTLARHCIHRHLDLTEAVRLAYRALAIRDDRDLRSELSGWLTGMGRLIEAGHVLLHGGDEPLDAERHESLLAAGALFARGGDSRAAVRTLREAGVIAPDDARPLEMLASIACYAPETLPLERAALVWLEAARRYPADSDVALDHTARAFAFAPGLQECAEAMADALARQGRAGTADEVLRAHGAAVVGESDVVRQRPGLAWALGAWPTALGAAIEACIAGAPNDEERDMALADLLERPGIAERLGATAAEARATAQALLAAARTRTSMGRAKALAKVAADAEPELRGVLLAVAADSYAIAGNAQRARQTALEAARVAPRLARTQGAVLELCREELGPAAFETAAGVLPARDGLFRLAAERFAAEGEPELALCWTRRALELRPGDGELGRLLLERAVATGHPSLMADAALFVLSLPRPLGESADALAALLVALGQTTELALDLGRRVVGTLGTGRDAVWEALLTTARVGGDVDFELALLARRAATGDLGAVERAALFLACAELSLQRGDGQTAAEYAALAAPHADLAALGALLDALEPTMEATSDDSRSDGVIAMACVRAELEERMGLESAWMAWRELGGLLWDLAGDSIGAEEAFYGACRSDPARAPYLYARDLCDRLGVVHAARLVTQRAASSGTVAAIVARALTAVARLAHLGGEPDIATQTSLAGLRCDPSRGEALAMLETVASGPDGAETLNQAYDLIAAGALGRYGFRAAHYRGARQLEQRGAYREALRHAIAAFEAVPGEGATYKLLLRLAERCDERDAVVKVLSSVAASSPPESRGVWLKRAAGVAAQRSPMGRETRFELVLKAFRLRPTAELVEELRGAVRELLDHGDDEVVRLRFERAVVSALPRLAGPRGARTALGLCKLAAQSLRDPRLAAMAVQRAMDIDLEGSDFAPVLALVDLLATDDAATVALVEHIRELDRDGRYAVPPSLLELGAALEATLRSVASEPSAGSDAQPAPEIPAPPRAEAPASEPADSEAERQARARGDHQAIAHLLAARTQTTADPQQRRLIRLRRAAVLEQRLGQLDDACRELELILEEVGEDPTALHFLADLRHRRGQERAAATAWERASRQAATADERERDVTRAVDAWLACNEPDSALALLGEPELAESPALLRLRAKVAERLDNPFAVGEALAALARVEAERSGERPRSKPPSRPPPPIVPASRSTPPQAAISRPPPTVRAGTAPPAREPPESAGRRPLELAAMPPAVTAAEVAATDAPAARQSPAGPSDGAARLAVEPGIPSRPSPASVPPSGARIATPRPVESAGGVLEAVRLGYRLHGIGAPREAKRVINQLRSLDPAELNLEQRDLGSFLLAEALDAVQGGGAALKELERHWKHVGHTPLVAVGVAERMVRRNDLGAALHFFERAVGGRLQGLRAPGAVALKAADVAHTTGKDENARRLLELARLERDSRSTAEQRLGSWFGGWRAARDSEATLMVLGEEELAADGELGEELHEDDSQVFEASAFRLEAEALEQEAARAALPPPAPPPALVMPHFTEESATTDVEGAAAEPPLRPSGEYVEPSPGDVTLIESQRPADDDDDDDDEDDEDDEDGEDSEAERPTMATAPLAEHAEPGRETVGAETGPGAVPTGRPTPEPTASPHAGEAYEPPAEMFAPSSAPASGPEPGHVGDDDAFTTPFSSEHPPAPVEPHDSGTEFDLPSAEPSDEGPASSPAARVEGPEVPVSDAWAHEPDTTVPQGGLGSEPPEVEVAGPAEPTYDHDPEGQQPTLMPPPNFEVHATAAADPALPAAAPATAEPPPAAAHVPVTRATPPPPPAGPPPAGPPPPAAPPGPATPAPRSARSAAAAPESGKPPSSRPALASRPPSIPARASRATPLPPPPPSPRRVSYPSPAAGPPAFAPRSVSERPPASVPRMPEASLRPRRRLSSPELPEVQGPEEAQLLGALLEGSPQAAEALYLRHVSQGPGRSRDALRACQLWWSSSRGDLRALRELRGAAERDGNAAYARALDHVLVAFDSRAPAVDPPALGELVVQPELTTRLVFSGLSGGINEALGIVCETGKFRHGLPDYGLSGADRVPAGTPTPVGAVYTMLMQLLDIGAIRLFHQQRSGPLGGQAVLLSPLAAVLQGSADRDSPVLRYVVAEALAAAMPQCALVLGLPSEQLRTVLGALAAGFGAVGAAPETTPEQMRLADDLFHLVPAAAGRRLHRIYQGDSDVSFDAAYVSARRACRRAGLFASGDLGTAVGRTLEELELANEAPLGDADALPWLCRLPEVADLVELATRPEFAESRWRRAR